MNFLKRFISLFGERPYRWTLLLLQKLIRFHGVDGQIWPRNSFALGYLEPGFSDLDITLFSQKESSRADKFLRSAGILKKVIPLLGEINFYTAKKIESLKDFANFFELDRDPTLKKMMTFQRQGTPIEAAVFLLRQLEKDLKQIEVISPKRQKKWRFHFHQITSAFPYLQISNHVDFNEKFIKESVIDLILFLCDVKNPVFKDHARISLEFYLELVLKDFRFYKVSPSGFSDSWFYCWSLPRLLPHQAAPQKLNTAQIQFLEMQKRWEICGSLSQTKDSDAEAIFRSHLQNIDEVLKKLNFSFSKEEVSIPITANKSPETNAWK